jgi:hypothetical protein
LPTSKSQTQKFVFKASLMPYLTNQYKLNFMKNLLFTLLLFFTWLSPRYLRYYETATGTSYTLKTQLYTIIKGHTDNGYGGLYTIYQTSDVDNFYDGTVLDMYSENQTEPILIIIQGLHNDVVTILRKGLLQQRTYHSTIHLAHGFRCLISSPQRTVK